MSTKDLIARTGNWFYEANQMPQKPEPNVRQVAFYLGMQCEEIGEKLAAISKPWADSLAHMGRMLKEGHLDVKVEEALRDPAAVKEMLDGDMDLLWVSIGAARAQGADVVGAYGAVHDANYAKRWPDEVFHNDPATGKVLKPEGWTPPDLTPFIHESLRGGEAA